MAMTELAFSIGGTPIAAPSGVPTGGLDPTGNNILTAGINFMFIVATVAAIIYLILGGIRWSTSSGDPKAVEAARKQITYAMIGLVIVILSYAIVNFVGDFFNIHLFG